MAIRDRFDQVTHMVWGGAVVPSVEKHMLPQGQGTSANDQKVLARCEYLRVDRNFLLGYSAAFVGASGLMAKALYDHSPDVPVNRRELIQSLSKLIVISPIIIAGGFFRSAYNHNVTYRQCLQDPIGTLTRLEAEERAADKPRDAKRISLNIQNVLGPASWLAGAAAAAEGVAYYGVAAAEGVFASGLSLCTPGMRYFNLRADANSIL